MKNQQLPFKAWLRSFLLLLLAFAGSTVFAQVKTITGVVSDRTTGESLPGASVVVRGTTKGMSTDIDGKYSIQTAPGENVLVFSFVGYQTQEVSINNLAIVNVALEPSAASLEEVVVVGYGSTRVKDLTSSITTVKNEELLKTPSATPIQSLQGKVAGMQVISNGSPGDSPTVRIRGVGSFPGRSSEDPLYVVDGMFYDNIDFLNPAEIASISVMKDASAAAIYGVRAANGVVLIETKSGAYNQKTEITYNGYVGYQVAQNVVKMANSQQYTRMALEYGSAADESFILKAMSHYGRSRIDPNIPLPNTNWYAEILRPALINNNSLDVSGGTDRARYSFGTSYFYQDGIMDMQNFYDRLNLRTKLDFKAASWLDIGGNLIYSTGTKYNDAANAWSEAYFAVPIMPVYDDLNTQAFPKPYANAKDLGYRSGQNPFASMDNNIDRMKIRKMLANAYAEIHLIPKKLAFRTTYNLAFNSIDQRLVNLPWFGGTGFNNPDPTITRSFTNQNNQIWDNVLTYTNRFGMHNLTAMAGTSFKDEGFTFMTARGKGFPTGREQYWYLNLADIIEAESVSDNGLRQYGVSYFGRVAYNYSDKYLVYATLRRDGSNKYQQKWGNFPTVGIGWVVTEEEFANGSDILPYFKLRASWGQLGNDLVPSSDGTYTSTVVTTTMGGIVYPGSVVSSSYSALKWELTEETNIGFTSRLFNNKLSAEFDYYTRDTKNAAIPVIIPGTGESVLQPVGTIRNSGMELSLGWTNEISKNFNYNVGVNVSTLSNKATDLYGQSYIDGGTAEFRQRTYLDEPLMAFFGREVAGVYQNQAEIENDPVAVENGLEPGDFKYVDQNNDGMINDDDRVLLGSYFPNFIYGGDIGIRYFNWDFSISVYGQAGNKILNRKRGEIIWTSDGNLDADLAENRWHGDGTSNEYPSAKGLRKGWNQKMSDYFVEDGSFFRIQNLQLGYTIRNLKWLNGKFPETRVAFTAERPLSLFRYNGFTPEVPDGVDYQTHPVPAIYTLNLNVKF